MTRHDRITEALLERQFAEGTALARHSDVLDLIPENRAGAGGSGPGRVRCGPPTRYVARYRCKGLVRTQDGKVEEAEHFEVGIWFPPDYLRRVDVFQVLTWLWPPNVVHPNISDKAPFICAGHLLPGTPLVDILYQCFEIITYQKVTMREDDALNPIACAWARRQPPGRFPIDARPLEYRGREIDVSVASNVPKQVRNTNEGV